MSDATRPKGDDELSRHEVAEWVRTRQVGNSLRKLILQLVFERSGEQAGGGWAAFPSLSTIAWEACLEVATDSQRKNACGTVRRHLVELEKQGLIRRDARVDEAGRSTSNMIWLLVDPREVPAKGDDRKPWKARRPVPGEAVQTGEAAQPPTSPAGEPVGGGVGGPPHKKPQKEAPEASPMFEIETRDPEPVRRPVSYRGRRVSPDVVADAERTLKAFCDATGRKVGGWTGQGKASNALLQVIGAMLERPDVSVEQWAEGVAAMVQAPPTWVDGPWQIGSMFGPKSAEWTVTAAERLAAARPANGRGMSNAEQVAANLTATTDDYLDLARDILGER